MQLKQGKQSKEETQWWSTSAHSKGRHSGGTHQRKAKGGGAQWWNTSAQSKGGRGGEAQWWNRSESDLEAIGDGDIN